MMARSTTWPLPVRSRSLSAVIVANAAASAAMPSASPNGGNVGGPSGSPVSAAKPDIASASEPKPGRPAYGPCWPNAVTRTRTRRGLRWESRSQPRFQRSSVPGRKFSIRTSWRSANASRISWPCGLDRSSVAVRLLRPSVFHHRPTPSLDAPCPRAASGWRGCSIFVTSAPKSPRSVPVSGPANSVAVSRTRMPCSGLMSPPGSGSRCTPSGSCRRRAGAA